MFGFSSSHFTPSILQLWCSSRGGLSIIAMSHKKPIRFTCLSLNHKFLKINSEFSFWLLESTAVFKEFLNFSWNLRNESLRFPRVFSLFFFTLHKKRIWCTVIAWSDSHGLSVVVLTNKNHGKKQSLQMIHLQGERRTTHPCLHCWQRIAYWGGTIRNIRCVAPPKKSLEDFHG